MAYEKDPPYESILRQSMFWRSYIVDKLRETCVMDTTIKQRAKQDGELNAKH